MDGSMSRPACPYDNSCVESFFATMKKEQIYKRKYDTMEEVQRDVFEYIELFYNRKRMHGYFIFIVCICEQLIIPPPIVYYLFGDRLFVGGLGYAA